MHKERRPVNRFSYRPHGLLIVAAFILFGLAACGSAPSRVSDGGGTAVVAGAASKPTQTRGGAYYKDDGPDAVLPTDLDRIPDALPRVEPLHPPALRPYTALGQQFVPMTEFRPFRERGHASWYGRRFHGNPTAIGEPYDMYAMTAAHPTLPLPSYARVTNVANGRSVVVRVNDRGPFLRGRVIDLSYAAANRLGYINAGSALVEVEAITPEDIQIAAAQPRQVAAVSPAAVPVPSSGTPQVETLAEPQPLQSQRADASGQPVGAYLQLGAFATPANAEGLVDRIRKEMSVFADRLYLLDDGGRYRLQLGPFVSVEEARLEASRLAALFELQPFVVIR